MGPNDYEDFKPFFKAVLEHYHKIDLSKNKHVNSWDLSKLTGLPQGNVLDLRNLGLGELSMRVRTGRNLKKYPLPGAMTREDRINLEREMEKVFEKLKADPNFGGQ